MNKKNHLLLCMYNFAPIGGVRSIRWAYLVNYLYKKGWDIDVLTVRPSPHDHFYDQSLLKIIPKEINVYRSFPGPLYFFQHLKKNTKSGFPKATIEWLPFGLMKGVSLLSKKKYDLVISSGLPFVGHFLAYLLRSIKFLPWIADYGDPLGFNTITSRIKKVFGKIIERKILLKVDGLVVPHPEMLDSFLNHYSSLKKTHRTFIRNGIDERIEDVPYHENKFKFTIAYVGSFYDEVCEPNEFFYAIKKIKNIHPNIKLEFIFAGTIQKKYRTLINNLELNDLVLLKGQIPHNEAISIIKASNVNLYIGWKQDEYHFAFKIIEFAAVGRPILGISQSDKDAGIDFIKKNNLGFVISNERNIIYSTLMKLYQHWTAGELDSLFNKLSPKEFYWAKRADEMIDFFHTTLEEQRTKDSHSKMPKILFVMYNFPPIGGPRSFRWLNLLNHLSEKGWNIDVLTIRPALNDSFYDSNLEKNVSPNICVHRTFPGIYYRASHLIQKKRRGYPKASIEWLPFALGKGFKLIKRNKYDLILSSALPFVGHIAAYYFCIRSRLKWIADYGDPLGFNPLTSSFKRFLGKRIEGTLLKRSSAVVVPVETLKQDFISNYPFLASKDIRVIGYGVDDKILQIKPMLFDSPFVISYVGSFYPQERDPEEFFKAIKIVGMNEMMRKSLKVIIAGNISERYISRINKMGLDQLVSVLGYVSHKRALSILKGTDIILYIGLAAQKRHYSSFPFKVLESASTGRPILALKQSETDEGALFIKNNKLGIVIENKSNKIVEGLHSLWNMKKTGSLVKHFSQLEMESYSWNKRATEFESLFFKYIDETRPQ